MSAQAKHPQKTGVVRKLRCAVYTRKSSEEGLEQEFNWTCRGLVPLL